jgi:hypothetical protein
VLGTLSTLSALMISSTGEPMRSRSSDGMPVDE